MLRYGWDSRVFSKQGVRIHLSYRRLWELVRPMQRRTQEWPTTRERRGKTRTRTLAVVTCFSRGGNISSSTKKSLAL